LLPTNENVSACGTAYVVKDEEECMSQSVGFESLSLFRQRNMCADRVPFLRVCNGMLQFMVLTKAIHMTSMSILPQPERPMPNRSGAIIIKFIISYIIIQNPI